MKRIIRFNETDTNYVFEEDNNVIFDMSKTELQFDVKRFYDSFYGEEKDFSEIVLENAIPDNKSAKRVFDCISRLISGIDEKMRELEADKE
jgi:hypothetical protein